MKTLLTKARLLVGKGKTASESWHALKTWASSESHPFAMKAAVVQFLESYSADPEAVRVLPEVLNSAAHLSLGTDERVRISRLAEKASDNLRKPAAMLPLSGSRPSPAFLLAPEKVGTLISRPLIPSRDPSIVLNARNTILNINDAIQLPPRKKPPSMSDDVVVPGRNRTTLSAGKGEDLIQSLLEKMKVQGNGISYHHTPSQRKSHAAPAAQPLSEKKASKKAPVRKKQKKRPVKKIKAKKSRPKPVKKKPARKKTKAKRRR